MEGEIWHAITEVQETIMRLERRMDKMADDQAHLDSDTALLATAVTAIQAEITNLKAQPGGATLDFTALDAAVGAVAAIPDPATSKEVQ